MDFKKLCETVMAHPRYVANIEYGKPRAGHAEGKVKNHIADLEENLEALRYVAAIPPEAYWKLKVLIHVHDSFKMEAKRDSPILHPRSHASLAKAFLAEYTSDKDMLAMAQYHDIGYAVYKKFKSTGWVDEARLRSALGKIKDKNLFLLFVIIDSCTASKGREMVTWFVEWVNKNYFGIWIKPSMILPESESCPAGTF